MTIQERNGSEQIRWAPICNDLSKKFPHLVFNTEIFDIVNISYEAIATRHDSSDNYHEIANETGTVSGILLLITRKEVE